ncbi:MAG TPA: FG-GAP-like repeat-containing protein, partial [Planctomycetota bacterium]|nr:FG-GAP-like repeat-containing protein [Planctomycetota bacterium]
MRLLQVAVVLVAAGSGGLGFWKSIVDVPDVPKRLDAADLDGDGDVDLFVLADAAGEASSLQVLLNDGGQFTPGWSATQSLSEQDLPWDLDLADTDNDGDADALYLLPYGAPYQRFNDGDAGFDDLEFVPTFAGRAEQEPVDMDDDGDIDLVYYEEDIVGYLGTLQGSGDGSFEFDLSTETWGLGSFDLARRIEIGDIDGDGLRDAAMASKNGLQFIPTRPPGAGSTLPGFFDSETLYVTACADVDLAD